MLVIKYSPSFCPSCNYYSKLQFIWIIIVSTCYFFEMIIRHDCMQFSHIELSCSYIEALAPPIQLWTHMIEFSLITLNYVHDKLKIWLYPLASKALRWGQFFLLVEKYSRTFKTSFCLAKKNQNSILREENTMWLNNEWTLAICLCNTCP